MRPSHILSRTIAPLCVLGACALLPSVAQGVDHIWDGGGVGATDLGTAVNWNDDLVPSVAAGDVAIWNGSVTSPLALVYSNNAFAGAAGNPGVNFSLTAGQTDSLNIDAGLNTASLRLNNVTIAAGAGAFSLGNGTDVFNLTLGGAGGQTHTWTNDSSNAVTIGTDVAFGLGGGGVHTLAIGGSGNWDFQNVIGQGAGTLTLSKSGAGTLNLGGANTYTGGVIMNAGTLNIRNASALGSTTAGVLTINGGTIDNTSGAALTTTVAKAQAWNGDFVFTGTNNLSFSGGAVTIGGTGTTRTVNVAANALSTGVITTAAGMGFTKTGSGTLAMTSTANNSNIAGILDVQAGKLLLSGDMTMGGLSGSGTIENGGAASKWIFINSAVNTTFSGSILDNTTNAAVRLGLVKRGVGNLTLTGNNTVTDRFAIENGTITLTGVNNTSFGGGGNQTVLVGSVATENSAPASGVLAIDGGTLNANRTTGPSFTLAPAANTRGVLRMTSGALNSTKDFFVADGAGSYGAINISGGSITSGNWFAVGRTGNGIVTMTGGSIQVNADNYVHGSFTGTTGVTTMTGGTISIANGALMIGETGAGIFTIAGTGAVNIGGGQGLYLGTATGPGIANLNGGSITTPQVHRGGGTGTVNFNGGSLTASLSGNFMQDLTAANVYAGGATLNTNGNTITVAQPLLAPTGSGVTALSVAVGGAGYIDAPLVAITGGTGTGATAIANVVNGVVTGFAITNPGTGYSPGDVLTATLTGGGATTAATPGTFTFGTNTSGGLTKIGAGSLTLSGASTYAGPTNIQEGALILANATGSATGAGALTFATGTTLGGTGTALGAATIPTGSTIVPGINGIGTLTLGGLTLGVGSFLDYEFSDPGTRDLISVTGLNGLTINGGTMRVYQTGTTSPFAVNGVYNVIGYSGTLGGTGISALSVDPATQDGSKTYTFGTAAGFVTLTIGSVGVLPNFWNVDSNGNWTTAGNWSLGSAPDAPGALANFGGGGVTITAPRTVTLNANQTVGTLAFNSAQSYTVSGANTLTLDGGAEPIAQITNTQGTHTLGVALAAVAPTTQFTILGVADLLNVAGVISGSTNVVKNGSGTLQLSNANTFFGSTSVSSGTLLMSGAGTLGDSSNPVSVSGGTLDLGATVQATNSVTMTGGAITNGTLLPISVTASGAGTSQIAANISGSATVTKEGAGTLVLSGNNTYTGDTTVNAGVLVLASANSLGNAANALFFNSGVLQVNGTAATTLGATRVLFGFPTAVNIADAANNFTIPQSVTSSSALVKQGAGTLTLTGTNAFPGTANTTIQEGRMVFDGGSFTASNATNNLGIEIAPANSTSAAMTVKNGAVINTNRVIVGGNAGNNAGGSGTLDITGGIINSAQWFAVGSQGNGSSTVNMSGGTVNVNSAGGTLLEVAVFGAATGTFNISGDAQVNIWNNASIQMGSANNGSGSATINQSGGAVTFYSDAGTNVGGTGALRIGSATGRTGTYTYNLDGGTLTVPGVARGSGTSFLNFNGGTIRPTTGNANFIVNTIGTVVKTGGARVDTNGFDIGIQGVLAHDAALGSTLDGGLTKQGNGILTLSGANTYTGPTVVEGGTLAVTGSISGTSAVDVKMGATVDFTGLAGGFTLGTGQTLKGAGSVNGNVVLGTGAILSPGESPGVLTVNGSLNLTQAVAAAASHALAFEIGSLAFSDVVTLPSGTLNIGTALAFDDFSFSSLPGIGFDTYTLFATNSQIGGALDANTALLTGEIGGGFFGTLALADGGTDLVLVVVPEPASAMMMLGGLGMLAAKRRRRDS